MSSGTDFFFARTGLSCLVPALVAGASMVGNPVTAGDPIDLLPDLVVREDELHDHDLVTDGARVLLRLATATANAGTGPVHLVGLYPPLPDGDQLVNQRIFRSDGSSWEREAGQFEFHPTHRHVHFGDWAVYRLREYLEGGEVGAIVAEGGKTSFCLLDTLVHDWTLPGTPLARVYTRCGGEEQGISVGWGDLYAKNLYGQNIDAAGVPQGTYWLEVEVDPENQILESDEDNNLTRIPVEIGEPVFLTKPLELPPAGETDEAGKIDVRAGSRPAPHKHEGRGRYLPQRQETFVRPGPGRRIDVHVSVANGDHHTRVPVALVKRRRAGSPGWTHFETSGDTRLNVTAALESGGHLLVMGAGSTRTFHSRLRMGAGRLRRLDAGTRPGPVLVFEAGDRYSRDAVRVVVQSR